MATLRAGCGVHICQGGHSSVSARSVYALANVHDGSHASDSQRATLGCSNGHEETHSALYLPVTADSV